MNFFPGLNDIFTEPLEDSFSSSLQGYQQSMLWIGGDQTAIAAITMHDMGARAIVKVYICDIHLVKLNVEITPETVLIEGEPTESSIVEGYFRPSGFESLVPLPYSVQPETCRVEVHPEGLTIELTKQLGVQQPRVRIEALTANFINPQILRNPQPSDKIHNF
ncbi:MAG: Hsp20/alpha crystallin family protein [Lyngbya sp.]|nr:Hsp20/alpha crystallin family protein [Lyngbya sp.]